jgi:hypothetical protein
MEAIGYANWFWLSATQTLFEFPGEKELADTVRCCEDGDESTPE